MTTIVRQGSSRQIKTAAAANTLEECISSSMTANLPLGATETIGSGLIGRLKARSIELLSYQM